MSITIEFMDLLALVSGAIGCTLAFMGWMRSVHHDIYDRIEELSEKLNKNAQLIASLLARQNATEQFQLRIDTSLRDLKLKNDEQLTLLSRLLQ